MGKVFLGSALQCGYDPFAPSPLTYTLRFQYLVSRGVTYSGPGATQTKLVTCRCCAMFVKAFHIWCLDHSNGQFFLLCSDCHEEMTVRCDALKHSKN